MHQGLMKGQKRCGPVGDGGLSDPSGAQEERRESAEKPISPCQTRTPPPPATHHARLLLEQEILRHPGSPAPSATQLRGHDNNVEKCEKEVHHARVSAR